MGSPHPEGNSARPDNIYRVDFACADDDPMQAELNSLYEYGDDLDTKIAHRNRLNLFYVLMRELRRDGTLARPGRALDIGCSAGVFSGILAAEVADRVLGIDVSADSILRARSRFASEGDGPLEFRVQQAEDLVGSGMFDFILCTEVIEHAEDPRRLVDAIRRLLASGGIAVVSLPNGMSVPYFAQVVYRRIRRLPFGENLLAHLQFPSYRSVRLFRAPSISVVKTTGTNLFLSGPLLRRFYRTSAFTALNRMNFALARRWPLKYFAQFFFLVLRKERDSRSG